MRKSGVLLPVSSIPSKYGIGTFSKQAYAFIDLLEKAGQSYWQILPLGPTGYGDSPYQSFSTFAGNPYYIDLEALIEEGYLTKADCDQYDFGDNEEYIDYEKIYLSRFKVLKTAYHNSQIEKNPDFQKFITDNSYWLDDYALYMAVKNSFEGKSWSEWDEDIKLRKPAAMEEYREKYAEEVIFYQFQQYLFAKQWFALKAYANKKKIQIIGDIPIYVAFDSADTWANPELFQLDDTLTPVAVAGCPPDAFAADGQLWGNPLYNWDKMKEDGYTWWVNRVRYQFEFVDVLRIDHFRGFESYFCIPYGDTTARNGVWKKGPGAELFRTIEQRIGKVDIIAEDLGFLTPEVIQMVKDTGYPGMKVLQFAFDPRDTGSGYLPHLYTPNSVVYPGTHDNQTITSWMSDSPEGFADHAIEYLHLDKKEGYNWGFIRSSYGSVSQLCVVQMQDILGLDDKARMNIPSTTGGNWTWRASKKHFTDALAAKLHRMSEIYGRLPEKKEEPSVDTDARPAVETA